MKETQLIGNILSEEDNDNAAVGECVALSLVCLWCVFGVSFGLSFGAFVRKLRMF
jgi:hypothetical protein